MIHEYRTYTLAPHLFETYCRLAIERGIPIRRDDYGRLAAFWSSQSGSLCQVHHIWEYAGIDDRNEQRVRLFNNSNWMDDFIAHAWPTMQRQEVRFMVPETTITVPTGTNIYETRIYRTVVGRFKEVAALVANRPRPANATLVGIYTSHSPEPNEVVEIVAYPDIGQRIPGFAQSAGERRWFETVGHEIHDVQSTLLEPLPISPMP